MLAEGQGGLLDVVAHPDFAANGRLYPMFAHGTSGELAIEGAAERASAWRRPNWTTKVCVDSGATSKAPSPSSPEGTFSVFGSLPPASLPG